MEKISIVNQTGRIKEIAGEMNRLVNDLYQVQLGFVHRYQRLVEAMNKECSHPTALFGAGYICTECGITDKVDGEGKFKNFRNTVFQLQAEDRKQPDDVAFETREGKVIKKKGSLPWLEAW